MQRGNALETPSDVQRPEHATAPLHGQVAWVTGGGTGIGRAAAQALGRLGATVVVSGRRQSELEAVVAELRADGVRCVARDVDVAAAAAVDAAAASIAADFGGVDMLVCSAGMNLPDRHWESLTADGFARVVATNLNGVASCVAAVLPGMRSRRRGSIVVVSSWAGWSYLSFSGVAYSASKAALGPVVASINDQEGRHGVRATLLCPAETATPMMRARPVPPSDEAMARMLRPEDVADAAAYVCSAPPHVCLNEIVISPVWNRIYIGAEDLKAR